MSPRRSLSRAVHRSYLQRFASSVTWQASTIHATGIWVRNWAAKTTRSDVYDFLIIRRWRLLFQKRFPHRICLEADGDEDQAIAALLHDAVEDQGGLPTLNTIRHIFGNRVADTVAACSDSTESDPTKTGSWSERKANYLAHLRDASPDALLIAAADKLHNARAILTDYQAG